MRQQKPLWGSLKHLQPPGVLSSCISRDFVPGENNPEGKFSPYSQIWSFASWSRRKCGFSEIISCPAESWEGSSSSGRQKFLHPSHMKCVPTPPGMNIPLQGSLGQDPTCLEKEPEVIWMISSLRTLEKIIMGTKRFCLKYLKFHSINFVSPFWCKSSQHFLNKEFLPKI